MSSIIGLVICAAFVSVLTLRKTYAGFRAWMLSTFTSFLGMLLVGMRNLIPDLFSIVFGGILIVAFLACIAYGLQLFLGQLPKMRNYAMPMGAFALAIAYFTYIAPSVNARIIIVSGFLAAFNLWCACIVHQGAPKILGCSNRFLTAAFAVSTLLNLVRFFLAAFVDPEIHDFMTASVQHGVAMMLMAGVHSAIAIGLLILNFQRVERDLRESLDEIKILKGIIPICAACKKVRDDNGSWSQLEAYIRDHSEAEFSHGICPDCSGRLYPEYSDRH